MPRMSQWAHNEEMWEFAAALRKGGASYSEIQGRLAGRERERFGLVKIPSADTLRYQLTKRALLGKGASPLPPDELESHLRALTYLGIALRELIEENPPEPRPGQVVIPGSPDMSTWQGFTRRLIYKPEAMSDDEAEVRDEWSEQSSGPDSFSYYPYFRQHMDDTLAGRKVSNALDAVRRTATEYVELSMATRLPARSPELNEAKVKLNYAQSNLRNSLTPSTLVRRTVQDGECELCSSVPLTVSAST